MNQTKHQIIAKNWIKRGMKIVAQLRWNTRVETHIGTWSSHALTTANGPKIKKPPLITETIHKIEITKADPTAIQVIFDLFVFPASLESFAVKISLMELPSNPTKKKHAPSHEITNEMCAWVATWAETSDLGFS
jgi:hypothetical protein